MSTPPSLEDPLDFAEPLFIVMTGVAAVLIILLVVGSANEVVLALAAFLLFLLGSLAVTWVLDRG